MLRANRKITTTIASGNYPIYFLIKQAGIDVSTAIDIIANTTSRGTTKETLLKRLKGKRIEQQKITSTNTNASIIKHKYYNQWLNDSVALEKDELKYCVQSLLWLDDKQILAHVSTIKNTMQKLYENCFETANTTEASDIRKAMCRIDEVVYFNPSMKKQ